MATSPAGWSVDMPSALLEELAEVSVDLLLVTDLEGRVDHASSASQSLLGMPRHELIGTRVSDLVRADDRARVLGGLTHLVSDPGTEVELEFTAVRADGSRRVLRSRTRAVADRTGVLVWSIHDVTEKRALEDELAHRAFHDPLTGLANRGLLVQEMDRTLPRPGHDGTWVAAVVVDLDDLKNVQDSLGRGAANEVVFTAAERLQAMSGPGVRVARTGSDQFALFLDGLADTAEAVVVTEDALATLAGPIELAGRSLQLNASAGVCVVPADGTHDSRSMFRDVDLALRAAKEQGTHGFVLFDEAMRERAQDLLDLAFDVRSATERHQIEVVYQPLVDLGTGAVKGFEALARWEHPVRGPVSPVSFIPIAEESGAIHDIGRHVLRTACLQAAEWERTGRRRLRMSVNVSPRQFAEATVVDDVRAALADSGLPADRLILEITESALVDVTTARHRLGELRAAGVSLAMDDFGTGYSSLAYLRQLPLDILKIDKSFVDDAEGTGPAVLAGVIALGSQLGLETVAEGIEDATQLERVRAAGCTFAQGYLISRPMSSTAATAFLDEHHRPGTTSRWAPRP